MCTKLPFTLQRTQLNRKVTEGSIIWASVDFYTNRPNVISNKIKFSVFLAWHRKLKTVLGKKNSILWKKGRFLTNPIFQLSLSNRLFLNHCSLFSFDPISFFPFSLSLSFSFLPYMCLPVRFTINQGTPVSVLLYLWTLWVKKV